MPKYSRQKGASSIFIVIFLFLVLAVGAYFLYQNIQVNLKSGASNVTQSASGTLVKKGTGPFKPCGTNMNAPYALLSPKVLAAATSAPRVITGEPPPTSTPRPTPTSAPSPCLPLQISAKLANPLISQKVFVIGTMQKGIFYATSIRKYENCKEQCPGKDNVLRNCNPPEIDGSSQDSACNTAGRREVCGAKTYCCPTPGARWTTDLTKCPVKVTPSTRPTATPAPYVQVSYPNGGETINRNQTIKITWASGGLSNVLIYVVNSKGVVSLINGASANINGGTSTYSWVANPPNFVNDPNTSSNTYKIRIMDSSGKYVDDSNNYFTIIPPPQPVQANPVQ